MSRWADSDSARQDVRLSKGITNIMGREPNFSEMRDAIRQGQAKIAQGLKSGQMRSDHLKNGVPRPRLDPAHETLGKKPNLTQQSALFQNRPKRKPRFKLPKMPNFRAKMPKMPRISIPPLRPMLAGILGVLGVALVVLLVIWIGKALFSRPQQPPVADVEVQTPIAVEQPAPPRPVVRQETPRQTATPQPVRQEPVSAPAQTGNNVIVIQYITSSREGELRPVQDFFAQNGVATEIFRRGSGSYLVTRDRFDNPNRTGTDGHAALLRIREIGRRYATDTGDRQWGTTPFQDAYGMLRQD